MVRIYRWICTVVLMVFIGIGAAAQSLSVAHGTVKASDGEPLPGVTIRVKGSKEVAITDMDGHFKIKVPQNAVLTFDYLGHKTVERKASAEKAMDIVMEEDHKELSEVVVTSGYFQTDIRKSTGSVGILKEEDLKDAPLANVDMLMQGKLAGVNVQAQSGRPGESAKIRIRGTSSITGNNEPLWVVDGVPIQKDLPAMGSRYVRTGDFSTLYANGVAGISPQNIESINVLKDAAAAAIYGSQAQAGVIVITTKKGKAGATRLNYSGSVSVQTSPSRDANLMNSAEKLAYEQSIWDEFSAEGYKNGAYYPRVGIVGQIRSGYGKFAGMTVAEQDEYIRQLAGTSTDWFEAMFRNTVSTSHNVAVSGGSDKMTFYVSGGLSTNKGIVKKTASDGYNFSAKINGTPSRRLSYSVSADYSNLQSLSSSNSFDIFRYAYFANPYEKLYNADGSYAADNTYFSLANANGSTTSPLPSNGVNMMREIDQTTTEAISATTTLRADLTWRITDDFRLYGLASYTGSNDESDNEVGQDTYTAWLDRPFDDAAMNSKRIYGSMTQTANRNSSWLLRAQANYSKDFLRHHHISAVFGTEVRKNYAKTIFSKRYGYDPVTGNHSFPLLNGSSSVSTDMETYQTILNGCSGQSRSENAFASFYGALDYVLMNRYVANVTARSDGSNNFGSKEQFNMTWSVGLGWNLDEERFMKKLQPYVSHATVRMSVGLTGGVNKSVYPVLIMNYLSSYRNSDTQAYRLGQISNAPNPHLRWEHTRDWNASIDLGFMRDRVNLTVSAYRRLGYDLVTPVTVVTTTGFSTQSYNTSEQVNQGVEFMVNTTPVRTKNFSWSVSANVAYNQNVLTSYKSPTGSVFGDYYEGYPLGKIFTGISAGISPETGLYTYKPRPDAVFNNLADRRDFKNYLFYIGTSNYPWTGGLSTHFSYKDLSLSVNTSFSLNGFVKNRITPAVSYSSLFGSTTNHIPTDRNDIYVAHLNVPSAAAYRWTPDNPVTDGYPRLIDAYGQALNLDVDLPATSSTITDCVYYENASYWKIGSITLMYNLPERIYKKMRMTGLGVSFTANNLWIVSGYSGMNPETPGAVYPMSRSFSVGLNLGL